MFCNEDGQDPVPAEEGDVVYFIGYLSKQWKAFPASKRQYLSEISKYHEDAIFLSSKRTKLVGDRFYSYWRQVDMEGGERIPWQAYRHIPC